MTSVFNFIVKPVGDRYDNKVKVDGKELILNTKIESFKSVLFCLNFILLITLWLVCARLGWCGGGCGIQC